MRKRMSVLVILVCLIFAVIVVLGLGAYSMASLSNPAEIERWTTKWGFIIGATIFVVRTFVRHRKKILNTLKKQVERFFFTVSAIAAWAACFLIFRDWDRGWLLRELLYLVMIGLFLDGIHHIKRNWHNGWRDDVRFFWLHFILRIPLNGREERRPERPRRPGGVRSFW